MLLLLRETVTAARAMPLSASCLINRAEALEMIDEVIASLPQTLAAAADLLAREQELLAAAGERAEQLLADAAAEAEHRLSASEQGAAATAWGETAREQARSDAAEVRAAAEDFADGRLAHLEVILEKTLSAARRDPGPADPADVSSQLAALVDQLEAMLAAVRRGRERMHGRQHMEDLAEPLAAGNEPGAVPPDPLGSPGELG